MGTTMAETFKVVAATGHRPRDIPHDARAWLEDELPRVARKLTGDYGMKVGISGLALGADTWWAQAVLGAPADLWAYMPSPDQANRWSPSDQETWAELRRQARRERIFGPRYDVRLLHLRNRGMVEDSELLVAVMAPHRSTGGTTTTLRYARSLGRPVVLVDITNRRTTLIKETSHRAA